MTEEQKKYDKEYEEFVKNLELEKEKFKKDHPEKAEDLVDESNNVILLFICCQKLLN